MKLTLEQIEIRKEEELAVQNERANNGVFV